jgi:transposase InsO family protein
MPKRYPIELRQRAVRLVVEQRDQCQSEYEALTPLVVDALKMGPWRRDHDGHTVGQGLIHHSDAGFQFTAHLLTAGIDASIGTVGDALDNALMESTIGLYKTELIGRRGPWRTFADVELATAQWVQWYNARRLHSALDWFLQTSTRLRTMPVSPDSAPDAIPCR